MAAYGLREIHGGEKATIDIVFVHGLRGSREGTWMKDGVLWPETLLAKDIEDSRIYLFGDSSIIYRDQANVPRTEIENDAEDLCAKLAAQRSETDTTERPLVFVAHSLGGLVCAELMVMGSRRAFGDNASVITRCTRGIIFFGTPFRGSKGAQPAEIARKILSIFGANTQEKTLKLLGVDSERLNGLNTAFQETMRKRYTSNKPEDKIDAIFFYETLLTYGKMIVEPDSAKIPGCGDSAPIRANHLDMCKFKTRDDEGYGVFVAVLRKFMAQSEVAKPTDGNSGNIYNYGKAVNIAKDAIHITTQHNSF